MNDDRIRATIERLVDARPAGASICPSEVARHLEGDEAAWRALMPQVRRVAAGLAEAGLLQATRAGKVVDALAPGGPIRLSRPPRN